MRITTRDVSGDPWCERCRDNHAFTCSHCQRLRETTDSHETIGHAIICEQCYGESYGTCEVCGLATDSLNDNDYCENCRPDDDSDDTDYDGLIHGYNFKPEPQFHGRGRMFGLEVEMEVTGGDLGDAARKVVKKLGEDRVYLKSDGSINYGFELVTHPHSLAQHQLLWEGFEAPKGVRSYGPGNCGLHVHIQRDGLTQMQTGKFLVFVNSNECDSFITLIAQRAPNHYCNKAPKTLADATPHRAAYFGRYQAVNLQNRDTIEVRIFRGNTRRERILKAVEFCAALIEYCRDAPVDKLNPQAFTAYLLEHKRTYPNLIGYLREKEWIPGGTGEAGDA